MKLKLARNRKTTKSTGGELFIDGKYECYTLEDVVRKPGEKVYGETAIPAGTYKVKIAMSPKRGYKVPWVLDVPGFDSIQIHKGNTADDSLGCILVGQTMDTDYVGQSKLAFESLMRKLDGAKDITLEVA